MRGGRCAFWIVVLCLLIPSTALPQVQRSSTQTYLEELHSQGKERVIVIFKDEVDSTLVDKYNGKLIRVFITIKALVCEIPQKNIELLKQEEAVKDVVPDVIVEADSGGSEERDPQELAELLRLKEEYFQRISDECYAATQLAHQEFLTYYYEVLLPKRSQILLYSRILRCLRDYGYAADSWIYRCILSRYEQLVKEYYALQKEAFEEYYNKIRAARNAYAQAAGEWEEKVNEMVVAADPGPIEVRWNNLEAGLNSQAAWNKYGLDGTGIKIAFLDTGVNYEMENLDDNYLGGYDFVNDDDDPINDIPEETHGTVVVSLAVGEGVDKVVGVAHNASYYMLKVLNENSLGFISDFISGVEWASTEPHKADIISMSLVTYGGGPFWPPLKQAFGEACNNAYNKGIVVVAGSGNKGYDYSAWPAAYANVISVGAHAEDQTLYDYKEHSTNGGVDVIAPGARVYSVHPDNSTWWIWGTSAATPHASALIALQLQHARQRNMEINNGYNWEVMKQAAIDLGHDPVYQGKGKIWAAYTEPAPEGPDPHLGSIDLMSTSIWPFDYSFAYSNYLYLEDGLYPAYFIGTNMYQDITLTNISDIVGSTPVTIENLEVTTTQTYYGHDNEDNLPGSSIEEFFPPSLSITAGASELLGDTYYLPWEMIPGLNKTILDLEFTLAGDSRLLKIRDNEASIWCPPPVLNEGFPIIRQSQRRARNKRRRIRVRSRSR